MTRRNSSSARSATCGMSAGRFRARPILLAATLSTLALAACKPPAADEYVERVAAPDNRIGPGVPIDSPDTQGAVWAESDRDARIIYGRPGQSPWFALACEERGGIPIVHITRFIAADPEAQAMMALIGNGHRARLPVDAQWNGRVWLWEGYYAPDNPDLDVLTGPRQVEATVPGAGSVIFNPSQRPARLIDRCRRTMLMNLPPA